MKNISLIVVLTSSLLLACTTTNKKATNDLKLESPKLLKGVVRKIWIPPELRNNGQEWIDGHYLYRIERGASWSR